MSVEEFYQTTSSDYKEIIGRLGNDSLVKRFVLKFADDPSFGRLTAAIDNDETEVAFDAAHTLKGVAKNLSFTKLGNSASEITDLLRVGNLSAAKEYYHILSADYDAVIAALRLLQ